ncbi:acyltransferase [Aureimonas sp. AU12]|uniref:acyltransferase family protein n=1 Tax=Aureimonas sp. AU12 TaxID=1638161 RepID=UPI000785F405|nr:acyltransferase [Aureimonas sp. AU12]
MYFRIFDCWRFTAAMLVMTYHFLYFAPGQGAVAGTAVLHRLLPLLDMFFMISGFFIASRYHDKIHSIGEYATFLRRRIARLYPLHLITLAFFVGVALIGSTGLVHLSETQRWDFAVLPLQLLAVHAWGTTDALAFNYPSWSVSAEIFCYLLFPLILVVARDSGLRGLVLLLAVWVGALELLSRRGVFPSGHWTDADTLGAYRAFADFLAGSIAALLVGRRVLAVRSHLPGLGFLALAVAAMLGEFSPYVSLVLLFLAILFVGLSETARPRSTAVLAPLMPLTRLSFGIYLWHPVMETIFLSLLWKRVIEPTGTVSFYLVWLLPMAASIAAAFLSERFLEGRIARVLAGPSPAAKPKPAAVLAKV